MRLAGDQGQNPLPPAWWATGGGAPRQNRNAWKHGARCGKEIARHKQLNNLLRQMRETLKEFE